MKPETMKAVMENIRREKESTGIVQPTVIGLCPKDTVVMSYGGTVTTDQVTEMKTALRLHKAMSILHIRETENAVNSPAVLVSVIEPAELKLYVLPYNIVEKKVLWQDTIQMNTEVSKKMVDWTFGDFFSSPMPH
jgi:hypothetical protein